MPRPHLPGLLAFGACSCRTTTVTLAEGTISIEVQVVDHGATISHHLEFGCSENAFNVSTAFCEAHALGGDHCQTLRNYAYNKHEAVCVTTDEAWLETTAALRNRSAEEFRPGEPSKLDACFDGFTSGPEEAPEDEISWMLPPDINSRLAQLVTGRSRPSC